MRNTLFPTDRERIAAWFLDAHYDARTFCICQAFFPDKSKWNKLAKALSDADVIEEDAFEALSGLTSLPFPQAERLGKGETWRRLVICPNLTIKERLNVLRPGDPNNYYELFDIVPSALRPELAKGKVLVTNWHWLAPEAEVQNVGGAPIVRLGPESAKAFARNRLGEL